MIPEGEQLMSEEENKASIASGKDIDDAFCVNEIKPA